MVKEVRQSLVFQDVLAQVRAELDDHLDAINNNTDEIEGNHELIYQLMTQLDKLTERVDQVALYLKKRDKEFSDENVPEIKPLTRREKEVFGALYELNCSQPAVSYRDLAKRLEMPISLVQSYVTALIEKGVPVQKHYQDRMAFLSLKPSFARLQAKNNVMGVDAKLTAWM